MCLIRVIYHSSSTLDSHRIVARIGNSRVEVSMGTTKCCAMGDLVGDLVDTQRISSKFLEPYQVITIMYHSYPIHFYLILIA